jgi:uncharacterized protein
MRPRAVFDTNVIVSAVLIPGSIPASLIALALTGAVVPCFSPAILTEYETVLRRPKFGFDAASVNTFLRDLKHAGTLVHPTASFTVSPDGPDNRFLECAVAAQASYLVTGNARDFPVDAYEGVRILSPAEFAAHIIGSG